MLWKCRKAKKKQKKTLWKFRLLYGLLWVASGLFYVFNQRYLSHYLFTIMTVLPWITFMMMQFHSKKVKFTIQLHAQEIRKSENASFMLRYAGGWFPYAYCDVEIIKTNLFYQTQESSTISMLLGPKAYGQQEIVTAWCGCEQLQIRNVTLYDMLGLWKKNIPCHYEQEYWIMPMPYQSAALEELSGAGMTLEKESHKKGGTPSHDSYEIREYQQGDSLKQLHHKVSFKLQKLMVRDYHGLEEASLFLFLDFGQDHLQTEQTLAIAYGFVKLAIQAGRKVTLCWYQQGEKITYLVQQEADYQQAFYTLLRTPSTFITQPASNENINEPRYYIRGNEIHVWQGKES